MARLKAAAIYGTIAGVAAVAGRVVAGDSFRNDARDANGTPNGSRLAAGDRNGSSGNSGAPAFDERRPPLTFERQQPQRQVIVLRVEPTEYATISAIRNNVERDGELSNVIFEVANR